MEELTSEESRNAIERALDQKTKKRLTEIEKQAEAEKERIIAEAESVRNLKDQDKIRQQRTNQINSDYETRYESIFRNKKLKKVKISLDSEYTDKGKQIPYSKLTFLELMIENKLI